MTPVGVLPAVPDFQRREGMVMGPGVCGLALSVEGVLRWGTGNVAVKRNPRERHGEGGM
jgi:hypothetical protein